MNTSTEILNKITIQQLTWKPSVVRNIGISIVEHILQPPHKIWPDDIKLDWILSIDRNCVGIAWRLLGNAGVIQQTGQHRKSAAPGRNSGIVFEYELKSRARAETFLRRNGRADFQQQQTAFLFN